MRLSATLALLTLSATASAIPLEIAHQGRLVDSAGSPIDAATDLEFKLYDGASGGTAVWSESHSSTNVENGYFSVILGTNSTLDADDLNADNLYVGISVDGSELPDRVRLTASPWAIRAVHAENAVSVSGGSVDATSVSVGGTTVIDSDGLVDFSALKNVPDAADPLPSCSSDQLLQYSSGSWNCIDVSSLSVSAGQITDGTISADRLDFGTGSGQIAEGSSVYSKGETYPQGQLYTKAEVDAMLAAFGAQETSLGERIAATASRNKAYTWERDWRLVPELVLPFTAGEGPIEVFMSIPMNGGSHSACRPMMDGIPLSLYSAGDTSYHWSDGLTYSTDGWAMWTPTRIYDGIAQGNHTLTVECMDDSTSADTELGNSSMTRLLSVVPYGDPSKSDVKAYTKSQRGGATVSTSFSSVSGLNTQFVSTGGPVKISVTIPMNGGSTSSCRPLIDGVPAGQGEADDTSYIWQEGLMYTADGWGQWERTRIYEDVVAGTHNVTVECVTDSGTVTLGNDRMPQNLSVVTYPKNSENKGVRTYFASVRGNQNISRPYVKMSNLTIDVEVTDGPVEVGYSLPINGGSSSTCRLLVDGSATKVDHNDNVSYFWQSGIEYSVDGWAMWDAKHVFHSLSEGTHNFQIECQTDSGTTSFGHSRMVSTVWAVAHDL